MTDLIALGAGPMAGGPRLAVWTASYAGWIPAVGLMPRPARDRPGRPTAMVLGHLVFGATLGMALEAIDCWPGEVATTAYSPRVLP